MYFRKKEVGGGSVLDLGVYTLHFVDTIFGPDKPECIVSRGILNDHGTDENVSAILKYPKGKMAVVSTHTKVKMDGSAYIYGTNGKIKVIIIKYTKNIDNSFVQILLVPTAGKLIRYQRSVSFGH